MENTKDVEHHTTRNKRQRLSADNILKQQAIVLEDSDVESPVEQLTDRALTGGENEVNAPQQTPWPSVLEDKGVVTQCIIPLVHQIASLERQRGKMDTTASEETSRIILTCGTTTNNPGRDNSDSIVHISQSDTWSCGYRNAQMMLCYLLPRLRNRSQTPAGTNDQQEVIDLTMESPIKQYSPHQSARKEISPIISSLEIPPVISKIQYHIEQSWKVEGFDPKGAQYYRYKIQNSKARIGAVEVTSLFRYWYVDATVVQFVKIPSSRRMLGTFVWTYFATSALHPPQQEPNDNNDRNISKSRPTLTAQEIMTLTQEKYEAQVELLQGSDGTCCCCPLYLQWDGHSVLIIGIERIRVTKFNQVQVNEPSDSNEGIDFNLLVFDPMKNGRELNESLEIILRQQSANKRQQKVLDTIRLPTQRLLHKDCQIIHCSEVPLSLEGRLAWREEIRSITATGYASKQPIVNVTCF